MSALKQIIDCVHGSPPPVYSANEMSAARRLLADPKLTVERVSKIMAFVTADAYWSPIVQSVEKLELHLGKIVEKMRKDPASEGDLPGWQAHLAHEDPAGPEPREAIVKTAAEKRVDREAPWRALIDEAHARGLRGPAMSRWVFAEREKRTGATGIATAASSIFDKFLAQQPGYQRPEHRRGKFEPQGVADPGRPKPAPPEQQPAYEHDPAERDEEGEANG